MGAETAVMGREVYLVLGEEAVEGRGGFPVPHSEGGRTGELTGWHGREICVCPVLNLKNDLSKVFGIQRVCSDILHRFPLVFIFGFCFSFFLRCL